MRNGGHVRTLNQLVNLADLALASAAAAQDRAAGDAFQTFWPELYAACKGCDGGQYAILPWDMRRALAGDPSAREALLADPALANSRVVKQLPLAQSAQDASG